MRSFFGVLEMENYQGDLADIVRAGGRRLAQSDAPAAVSSSWDYFPADTINNNNLSPSIEDNNYNNDRDDSIFGDPFCNVRDPLLHELNVAATAAGGSSYFSSSTNSADFLSTTSAEDIRNFRSANSTITTTTTSSVVLDHHHHHKVFEDGMSTSPCNIFSRIQISLNNNPTKLPVSSSPPAEMAQRGHKPSAAVVSSDMLSSNISKGCLIENSGQVQISSPRNLGIKRRKSQAKKVVCIPAPAAASSRSSGEVVPSDLWAWRKYGQKPIKGSPYPRGYYRCSSSKGCSARKQVERSRTDPNMLVITYTSEHNHPWPTQRNALAGSTRSQPPKNNIAGGAKSSPASQVQQKSTRTNTKEEQKESSNDTLSPTIAAAAAAVTSCSTAVKEEEIEDTEKQMEMDENEYSEGLHQSYRPALPESSQSEDFFADLGEIGADPLDLLFTQGFSAQDQEQKGSKALDPFSIFDWSASGDNNSSSFGEAKEGL